MMCLEIVTVNSTARLSMGVTLASALPGWEMCTSTTWARQAFVVPVCDFKKGHIYSVNADNKLAHVSEWSRN